MATVTLDTVKEQLLAVLKEGFEGSTQRYTYFTDQGPESGLFGTLDKVTATEASRPVAGSSIAAQTCHVVFSLEAALCWIRGDRGPRDWNESWRIQTVDDAAWARLKSELRERYQELRDAMTRHTTDDLISLGVAVGSPAHVAYHLGAIRQKVALIRAGS